MALFCKGLQLAGRLSSQPAIDLSQKRCNVLQTPPLLHASCSSGRLASASAISIHRLACSNMRGAPTNCIPLCMRSVQEHPCMPSSVQNKRKVASISPAQKISDEEENSWSIWEVMRRIRSPLYIKHASMFKSLEKKHCMKENSLGYFIEFDLISGMMTRLN